jgi:hypothetical protein
MSIEEQVPLENIPPITDSPPEMVTEDEPGANESTSAAVPTEDYVGERGYGAAAFKTVLIALGAVLSLSALLVLRRRHILGRYASDASNGDNADNAALRVYGRLRTLARALGLGSAEALSYGQYAVWLSETSKYVPEEAARAVINAALKASFSQNSVSEGELARARDAVSGIAARFYEDSGKLKKIYLKYILCIK